MVQVYIKDTRFDKAEKKVYFNAQIFSIVPDNFSWDDPGFHWEEYDNFSELWQNQGVEAMEERLRNEIFLNVLVFDDYSETEILAQWKCWLNANEDIYPILKSEYSLKYIKKIMKAETDEEANKWISKMKEKADEQHKKMKEIWDNEFLKTFDVSWRQ